MRWIFGTIAALAFCTLAAQAEDKAKADLDKLQGTWKVASVEANGQKAKDQDVEGLVVIVKDDTFTSKKGDKQIGVSKAKLFVEVEPRFIDFTPQDGDLKGQTLEGIYKLDGDDLTLCVNFNTALKERPTEFASKEGTQLILIAFNREKQ